jgi:metal-responsive CopG/Arc/MetJ family transcriptional regulator
MKVAISIPDPVFDAAERISRQMRLSRSGFYAKAVEAYVRQHSGDEITRRLDEVYSEASSRLDPAWEAGSLEVLRREKW